MSFNQRYATAWLSRLFISALVLVTLYAGCSTLKDSDIRSGSGKEDTTVIPSDIKWSERMARSVLKRYPRLYRSWGYVQGLILHTFETLGEQTHDERYLNYIQVFADDMIQPDGTIKGYDMSEFKLDDINAGRMLFGLYKRTRNDKYKKALLALHRQLEWQPRTTDGGFWHKRKYPWQMWLDGAYMATPFLVRYGRDYGNGDDIETAVRQLMLMRDHMEDPESGLYYHGWDESRLQGWADPQTGTSASFWGRGMGWYGMALVDVLDFLPPDHSDRERLTVVLQNLVSALATYQDEKTGLWHQVVDQVDREGNYLEGSASSMYVYIIARGVNKGYVDSRYMKIARKGYPGSFGQRG